MLIGGSNNLSQLKTCLEAPHHFLLLEDEVRTIFVDMKGTIEQHWDVVRVEAEMSRVDKTLFQGRQFLNSFSIQLLTLPVAV